MAQSSVLRDNSAGGAIAELIPSHDGDRLILTAQGRWVVAAAATLDRALRQMVKHRARAVRIDLSPIAALDTAGAWLIIRTRRQLEANGATVEVAGLADAFAPLFQHVIAGDTATPPLPDVTPPPYRVGDFTAKIGRVTIGLGHSAGQLVGFLGLVCEVAVRTLRHPSRLRFNALIAHMEKAGLDALPIVGMLAFLIGVVFAFQGSDQLRRFGAEIYTVNLLAVGILRELGVLIAAIIIAGRSGSAFTAQIGTMKVNEEVDAMEVLGLDPVEILVLPRVLAMMLTLPLVVFFANAMGLLGGALMCYAALDITIPAFLRQLHSALWAWTFWIGMLKAPIFAGIIALTGCYEGLRVARSAESVGRLTTRAVVESIFLIVLADAVFAVLFTYLGI